ncbi:hypothetical protein RAS1_25500 [Phycisphaerae bacterium RAS1]|nr:hypothetical protein RAS1_25500 [Phycisphaerae bacterium RAS1]
MPTLNIRNSPVDTRRCSAAAALCLCAGLIWLSGCAGTGRIELASLDFTSIDPPDPRIAKLDLSECYWWTDDDGRVWVALRRCFRSPFNDLLNFQFHMTLRFEKPPTGKARNYLVSRDELRAAVRIGPLESRFVSRTGIAALYRIDGGRVRGSLRMQVLREVSRLLGGWSKPSAYLLLGSFTAVPDRAAGEQIRAATEADGWERGADGDKE